MKRTLCALAFVSLAGISCTSEPWGCGMGAACPAMADVNRVRYALSGAVDLVNIEPALRPYAPISQSNSAASFADGTALAIDGIDPTVLLVARSSPDDGEPGDYRELWSLTDDPFPVAYCQYMTAPRQAATEECP